MSEDTNQTLEMPKRGRPPKIKPVIKKLSYDPKKYLEEYPPTKHLSPVNLTEDFKRRYTDDEAIYKLWLELGDSGRLYEHCVLSGLVSPNTGKPISEQLLMIAVFRYISRNLDACLKDFEVAYENAHQHFDIDEVLKSLIIRMAQFLQIDLFVRFIVENKLYEKYFDYIPKKSGLGHQQYLNMMESDGNYDVYRYRQGTLSKRRRKAIENYLGTIQP